MATSRGRENHSEFVRPSGQRSEARYGPGGEAARRRREQSADRYAQGATRGSKTTTRKRAARPRLLTPSRKRGLLYVLTFALAFACSLAVFRSPLTEVRQIRLFGVRELLPGELAKTQSQVVLPARTNVFLANTGAIKKQLEGLPWVETATISRRLPHQLYVDVAPRNSVARLQADGQDWEVDRTGVLIRPLRPGTDLPTIVCGGLPDARPGVRADLQGLAGALKVVAECAPSGGVRVDKVLVDQTGELCLNMSDTVAIRLGQEEALPTKIDYVHRIYDDKPGIAAEVLSIDLRWPESPSCVLRDAKDADNATSTSPRRSGRRSNRTSRD